jgi:hypothetical protein
MPPDMIRAAFGNRDINVEDLGNHIPEVGYGAALGSAECMAKCGLSADGKKKEEDKL